MSKWNRWAMAGVLCLGGGAALAETPRAAGPGRLIEAPNGRGTMEELDLERGVAAALLRVPLEGTVSLSSWPVAPGVRMDVALTRHEIYADDAKIVAIDGGREVEIPRSSLVFLWGRAKDDASVSVLAVVDPDEHRVSGTSISSLGTFDLHPPGDARSTHLLAPEGALGDGPADFSCGLDDSPELRMGGERASTSESPEALTSLHTAVLAFDTDNELLSLKFADDPSAAANYVASLVASLNLIYERDLLVRFLQGYTVLRLSTTPDPYLAAEPGNASGAKLVEVADYWGANYGGIRRALLVMLSGKQPTTNSASGVAYLSRLCSATRGTSFNQVFRNEMISIASHARLVGHEIGHNFGAPHTHCTDTDGAAGMQPIDFCYANECGSSWVPPASPSCPALFDITTARGDVVTGVRGTLMSYCNHLSDCTHSAVFHPLTISLTVSDDVSAAVGQCLFASTTNPAPTVSSITPSVGSASGGSSVTINGANFRSPATVAFVDLAGARSATSVSVVSSTRITASTPAHSLGSKSVLVQNPEGASGTLPNAFTYVASPVVTSVEPNAGPTTGGTPVTIRGANFAAPATVLLGATVASAVSVVDASTITATTPPHAASIVGVSVQSDGFTGTLPASYEFYVAPPPGRFYSLPPCRLLDTRSTIGALGGPALPASATRTFALAGVCGIPVGATALSVNITVTQSGASGFLRLYPGDGLAPLASHVNFATGQTKANNAVVLLATSGAGTLAAQNGSASAVHLILDVNGYFQ